MNANLVSIQIGKPKSYTDDQGTWETAFFKEPVQGPLFLGELGLDGDGVANTAHHGGSEQAVLLYSADHYTCWQVDLGKDLPYGAFAENLTIRGMDESSVHIGDVLQIGTVELQVTQPRIPCWKISRRWNLPDLTKQVTQTYRTGWYCRVLKQGKIEAGLSVKLLSRNENGQTVAQAFQTYLLNRKI
jgi:MOSC domain-containing protein YiiM